MKKGQPQDGRLGSRRSGLKAAQNLPAAAERRRQGSLVRVGSRPCKNSDVELARRKFVSIALNKKRSDLPVIVGRRKERKQFCAFSARARFHLAWVIFGLGCAQVRGPLYLDERTSSGRPGRSEKCQERTHALQQIRASKLIVSRAAR
jgi:hypothetical protein